MTQHRVTIRESDRRAILERQPRYDVLLNGDPVGELYYNMTGYVGGLPMVQGGMMDIGEKGISAWRKEAALLNREAKAAIEAGMSDDRRIVLTRPTSDNRMLLAISQEGGTTSRAHLLSRREFMQAEKLFETSDVGLGFFGETQFSGRPDDNPEILLMEGDQWMVPMLDRAEWRVMKPEEQEAHERYVDEVFETDDPEIRLVIGRRVADDADPEPVFVSRQSLDFGQRIFGDKLRIGDLEEVDVARISDPSIQSHLRSQFTWWSFDSEDETLNGPDF